MWSSCRLRLCTMPTKGAREFLARTRSPPIAPRLPRVDPALLAAAASVAAPEFSWSGGIKRVVDSNRFGARNAMITERTSPVMVQCKMGRRLFQSTRSRATILSRATRSPVPSAKSRRGSRLFANSSRLLFTVSDIQNLLQDCALRPRRFPRTAFCPAPQQAPQLSAIFGSRLRPLGSKTKFHRSRDVVYAAVEQNREMLNVLDLNHQFRVHSEPAMHFIAHRIVLPKPVPRDELGIDLMVQEGKLNL